MSLSQYKRLQVLLASFGLMVLATVLLVYGLKQHASAFVTPSYLAEHPQSCLHSRCRLGAMVQLNSLRIQGSELTFKAVDHENNTTIDVVFTGVLPSMFKEGKLMLAEGHRQNGVFFATTILAKHDENYKPKSI